MALPFLNLRLDQLEANINRVLKLVCEYENELLDEDDPARKSKYRRRIESLREQETQYVAELSQLKAQLDYNQNKIQTQNITSQLQIFSTKLDFLLEHRISISQVLTRHFTQREQAQITPFIQKIDQSDILNVQVFLEALEAGEITDVDINLILDETRNLLKIFQERNISILTGNESIPEIINAPTVDTKHALKWSIPLIPFILSYEGELGLGAGIKLKETWQRLQSKFGVA